MAQQQPAAQPQMKSSLRALLIGTAVIASAQLASASLSYDLAPISFNSLTGSADNYPTLSFAKFDTAGGTYTLTGVSLDWSVVSAISSVTVKNESAGSVTINAFDLGRTFTAAQGADSLLYDVQGKRQTFSSTVLTTGQQKTISNINFTTLSTGAMDVYGSFAAYTGSGNVDVTLYNGFSATPLVTASGGQDLSWLTTVSGSAHGTLGVTYSYELTPIPEPGSLLALGCLVGSGAFLRMRRRA